MKLLDGLLILVACAVAGMATGLLLNHVVEEMHMQEHRELERRALVQRTCKVCGSLGKPHLLEPQTDGTQVLEYHCECGASWTAPPLNTQHRRTSTRDD